MIVPVSRLLSHARPINAKFILPALLEATDPYWRPIKYSLFPPLGWPHLPHTFLLMTVP